MSGTRSRSSDVLQDEELRLPRAPGVIRRFWARHPRIADALLALICLLSSVGATASMTPDARPLPVVASVVIGVALIGSSVLILWRRRWPEILLAVAIAVEITVLVISSSAGTLVFTLAVYTLAVHRSTRACWVGLGVGVTLISALAFSMVVGEMITAQNALNSMLAVAVPGLIGALIGINVGNRRRYLEAVIDRSRQLLVERDQHSRLAAAAERDRIAREMHDIVSHSLTVVVALSEGAAATPDRDRARDASLAAATTARNALTEMRSMLGVLRDGEAGAPLAPLDPVSPAEIVAAARQAGFEVSLGVRGELEDAPALRFAIGRIVQEGVTNAMRHAPMANSIDVRIDCDADPIAIEIVNDGASGTPGEGGFGLRGLAERAALLGGSLVAAPAGRGRWMLRAELPHPQIVPTAPPAPVTEEPAP